MSINSRIEALRVLMSEENIDAFIIPTGDPHQSEYIPEHYKNREWISGFTGGAGTVVITKDKAGLWTDGRYFIQAENEIIGTGYNLFKMDLPGVLTYEEWLRDNLKDGSTVGFDGRIYSQAAFEAMKKLLESKNIKYKTDNDLVEKIWDDRPAFPESKAFIHELKYAGMEAIDKINLVRAAMDEYCAEFHIIGKLDDIAWLFNIRGADVPSNPMLISYAVITKDKAILFVNANKIDEDVRKYLLGQGVEVSGYEDVRSYISSIPNESTILLDKSSLNSWVFNSIPKSCKTINEMNPSFKLKSRKSEIELRNQKNAYIKDGVAVTKFLYWLEQSKEKFEVNEYTASEKLYEFRSQQDGFVSTSFKTIMAFNENAAMMHYRPSESVHKIIEGDGLLLIDSGGQYLDGTTDITRTIPYGKISDEQRTDCTLTLKSHIALIGARFLYGTSGHVLDSYARRPMWEVGMDYKCGTGHGIGYFLNVHEGPQRFHNTVVNNVALEENMIISIEPGVYKKDRHGVRIENIGVVKKDIETEFGQFMKFETLSFVYIDTSALNISMLTEKEIEWLNKYHSDVFEKISEHLTHEEITWLKEKTKRI
ncbi:MAG: aminopeptidase P family protein [Tissierellia bacterium]|nr:aminopeptidase P family protein [Tissierellia bacterium]